MGRRVLIVDDHEEMRDFARVVLEQRGLEVLEATNGAQALQVVAEWSPDLVVLDHLLEGVVTGLELAVVLAAQSPRPVVLVLSAWVDDDARFAGVDAVLNKAHVERLGERVARLLPPEAA